MASLQKTVLMLQPSLRQGEVWSLAMSSQNIKVIWEQGNINLVQILDQLEASGADLPQLLLIDMTARNINHFAFCRWCREHRPDLKIILTSANQTEISPSEQRWAVSQGAQDLLPAFRPETLLIRVTSGVSRVMEILECGPLQQKRLMQILVSLINKMNGQAHQLTPNPSADSDPPVLDPPAVSASPVEPQAGKPQDSAPPMPAPPVEKPAPPRRTYRGVPY
jgi:CheY-like chemotaxis protein